MKLRRMQLRRTKSVPILWATLYRPTYVRHVRRRFLQLYVKMVAQV